MNDQEIKEIISNPESTAKAVGLKYVNDTMPGITRLKSGKSFKYIYTATQEKCDDEEIKKRIRSLVIPPAWKRVWICKYHNGHLQATGLDMLGRKQYRYHPDWNQVRNLTKFYRMIEFGQSLPKVREKIQHDLALNTLCFNKVLAIIVKLMERTFIRIGSASYEKLYGSYGLTTLRDKHVDIHGNTVTFEFKGKKGVYHTIELKNKRLAQLVKKCRDIPGQELFQYYDQNGNRHTVDSGDVNNYLKDITHKDFTSKDFRTWAGSVNALHAFKEIGNHGNMSEAKRNIIRALDAVSGKLGNTRTVCKKYYVHPAVLEAYETGCLYPYLSELDHREEEGDKGLTCEEKLLMKLLKGQLNLSA